MDTSIDIAATTRASMLRMGATWQRLGKTNQAIDTYLRIIQEHPGSSEAESAKADLLEITQGFESAGRYHIAINILDRLNKAVA
jgi:hypothetical protein